MRASMAYFAGAGTIIAAIVAGVGGGLLMADIVSPKSPKQGTETTRLERRMSPEPVQAAAGPSEPVPYLSALQPSAPSTTVAAVPPQAQPEAANPASTPARTADTPAAAPREAPASQPATPVLQKAAHEPTAAPEDVQARARDVDVKRAVEKRKLERRQQWADKRRHQPRQEQDLQPIDEKVREDTEPRRELAAEPARIEIPLIRLFGPD
jgi:hypothetical protein